MKEYNRASYQIDFFLGGRIIDTMYWTGALEETRELARGIAIRLAADDFRIVEFNDSALAGRHHRLTDKGRLDD